MPCAMHFHGTSNNRRGILNWLCACALVFGSLAARGASTVHAATGPRCYVNASAGGPTHDGNSWATAYTQVYEATSDPACTDIWVAAGFYTQNLALDGTSGMFWVSRNLTMYGGFAGWETDPSQRNIAANVSILSGDSDLNDTNTDGNHIDETVTDIQGTNDARIVTILSQSTDITSLTVLDGFTITGGADSSVLCDASLAGKICSPTLANLTFIGNQGGWGSALTADAGSGSTSNPHIQKTVFKNNSATGNGGAVYDFARDGGMSNPIFEDVTFESNHSNFSGGAVYASVGPGGGNASPTFKRVTFIGNSAQSGGAVYNSAGTGNSSPRFGNVTFSGNSATADGGAIFNAASTGSSSSLSTNVTFVSNTAGTHGGAIVNLASAAGGVAYPSLYNAILWANTAPIHPQIDNSAVASATANVLIGNSVVEGGCPSIVGADCTSWGGNLSDDPLLLPLADNGGLVKTLAIEASGSARDAGDASYCADGYTEGVDARGVTRPQGPACDIGAYELQYPTGPRCYVKASAPGPTHDGNSWATAYAHLYDATALTTCKEIWVAAGFYTPHPISPGPIYYGLGLLSTTAVYGGFSGFETSLSQRDWKNNVSVLSGDVDHDDINVDGNHIDENVSDIQGSNTLFVVVIPGEDVPVPATGSTVLDGFTITGATASGVLCFANDAGSNCSPTLRNLTVIGNRDLSQQGGGMDLVTSDGGVASPTINNVIFKNNQAQDGGAVGIVVNGGTASPTLTDVSFENNSAANNGGAVYIHATAGGTASPTFNRATFSGNSAGISAGAVESYADGGTSSPLYANATFSGNSTTGTGGAIHQRVGADGVSHPTLGNVTFNGNHADASGGAIYNDLYGTGGTFDTNIYNTILWGDSTPADAEVHMGGTTVHFKNSVVSGGCASIPGADCTPGGNLSGDPLLRSLANNGGLVKTMAINAGSSAIDTGYIAVCMLDPTHGLDARGVPRPQGAACDIGAYEYAFKNVEVKVAGSAVGSHLIGLLHGEEHSYTGINSGPAHVSNTDGGSVVSSIRVLYGASSYSEMMGYPHNSTTDFWFPWYNNTAMDSQFRVSNLGASSTTITVSLGGSTIDSFSLGAGAAIRKNYPGQNNGPMHVSSSGGMPILATIRVLYGGTSFTEMMGYPNNTTTQFWFPWYNNTAMDSQFRVSNLGASPTTITVYLGASPIDSFSLGAGAAIRKNYSGQNNGPMHVTSSGGMPILATIRVVWGSSFSEMMGFPNNTTGEFWFPWYDNVGTDAQLRVSNLGGSPTTITVSLAGTAIDSFILGAGAALRKNYAWLNDGGLHVTSSGGMPILATVRLLYAGSSFYELMGYAGNALTSTQYFPWYNNTAMNSQMRIAVP